MNTMPGDNFIFDPVSPENRVRPPWPLGMFILLSWLICLCRNGSFI